MAFDTGIRQNADRGGMKDFLLGLFTQEERKETNAPIQNAEDLQKRFRFIVSHNGKQAQFQAKSFAELREFTGEDFQLLNTEYLFIYKAPELELKIQNQRNFTNLVDLYAVKGQCTLLEVKLTQEQLKPAQ